MTWEGKKDKMVHAYALCLLDYDFHILKNAFLVHRPTIKFKHEDLTSYEQVLKNDTVELLSEKIIYEMKNLYGDRSECELL